MSGFLGVLEKPAGATHLQKLARVERPHAPPHAEMSARVATVMSKVQALTELIKAKICESE